MCGPSVIYRVPEPWHFYIFILNICLPGTGTFIQAYCREAQSNTLNCMILLIAIAQMLLVPFVVGWVWSIVHGYKVYRVTEATQFNHP